MRLAMLGTNGAQPSDDAQTCCYMLPEVGVVLDAGSGLYRLTQYMKTDALDIYLSHAHTDHTLGLGYLFVALKEKVTSDLGVLPSDENMSAIDERTFALMKEVRIHAAGPTLSEVRDANYFLTADAQWLALDEQEELPANGVLTRFDLAHTGKCHGFRLDWPGRSLAYVTDTTADPDAPYVERIHGVDVLLHESYLPDRLAQHAARIGHSVTTPVVQVAAKAEVGRLILVHKHPSGRRLSESEWEYARTLFARIEYAEDGMEVEF